MVNWKYIHRDFENNPRLISEWEEFGFTYLECKEWIETGLEPQDAKYAFWLEEMSKQYSSQTNIKRINQVNVAEETLHLRIDELKKEKGSEIIIQSLTKLLRRRNNIIRELYIKCNPFSPDRNNEGLNRWNWNAGQVIIGELKFNQTVISEETLKRVKEENEECRWEKTGKGNRLVEPKKQKDEEITHPRTENLEQLKNTLKSKLDEEGREDLDDLLETQAEFSKNNSSYVQKQLERSKRRLLKDEKLTKEEIEKVCELQSELTKLEDESNKPQLENKIEIVKK